MGFSNPIIWELGTRQPSIGWVVKTLPNWFCGIGFGPFSQNQITIIPKNCYNRIRSCRALIGGPNLEFPLVEKHQVAIYDFELWGTVIWDGWFSISYPSYSSSGHFLVPHAYVILGSVTWCVETQFEIPTCRDNCLIPGQRLVCRDGVSSKRETRVEGEGQEEN